MERINILKSIICVQGKVLYNDRRRRIDLKKPIKEIFESIEDEKNPIQYRMELCLSKNTLLKRTSELADEGIVPILFYFIKENKVLEHDVMS